MNLIPLSGHVPALNFVHRWEHREKFMSSEDQHRSWIIFAVEDGAFYYRIQNKEGTASFGDLVLCPAGETFRRVVISPLTLFVIHFRWADDKGKLLAAADIGSMPFGKISLADTLRLSSTYRRMKQVYPCDNRWKRQKMQHYLYDVWLQLCEEQEERLAPPATDHPASGIDPIAEKASLLIRQHAFQPVHLQEIADTLHTSMSQLCKKFKKRFGITPIQFLTSQRLEKAKTLLLETNLTLDQISECCGYQNGFYLNRVFTKHMNMTPTQFRISHRI